MFCFGSVRGSFAIVFFSIVLFNAWPCHAATLTVHKYTTVSVKIAWRTLLSPRPPNVGVQDLVSQVR